MEHTIPMHDSRSAQPATYDSGYEEQSYEQPVPLHPHAADPVEVEDGWVQDAQPSVAPGDAMRRIVLRMSGGEAVELAAVSSQDEALAIARDFVRRIAQAESAGEWPEFEGRFLRTDTIVSVDVEVGY